MSSNGPPPNKSPDFEKIKTRLQQAGLSLEEIEKTFQAAKEAVRVLGMFLEQASEAAHLAISPPPTKKQHHPKSIVKSAATFRKELMRRVRTRPDAINQSLMELEILGEPFGLTDMLDWDSNTDDLDLDIF
jgi:hypothetical protein